MHFHDNNVACALFVWAILKRIYRSGIIMGVLPCSWPAFWEGGCISGRASGIMHLVQTLFRKTRLLRYLGDPWNITRIFMEAVAYVYLYDRLHMLSTCIFGLWHIAPAHHISLVPYRSCLSICSLSSSKISTHVVASHCLCKIAGQVFIEQPVIVCQYVVLILPGKQCNTRMRSMWPPLCLRQLCRGWRPHRFMPRMSTRLLGMHKDNHKGRFWLEDPEDVDLQT